MVFNRSNETLQEDSFHYEWNNLTIYYWVFRLLWMVFGIFGNTLTLVAIWKFENLQALPNYNIASLAAADIIQGTISPILALIEKSVKENSTLWSTFCTLTEFFVYMGASCNVISVFWIAVDRYIFIHKPLRYYTIVTRKRVLMWLCSSWVYFIFMGTMAVALAYPAMYQSGDCNVFYVKSPCIGPCIMQSHLIIVSTKE